MRASLRNGLSAAAAGISMLNAATPVCASSQGHFDDGVYVAPGALFTSKSPLGPGALFFDSFDRSTGAVTFLNEAGELFGVVCTPNLDVLAGADTARTVRSYAVVGSPAFPTAPAAVAEIAELEHDRDHDEVAIARQAVAVVASGDRTRLLRALDVPTLVLHGLADTFCDPRRWARHGRRDSRGRARADRRDGAQPSARALGADRRTHRRHRAEG